MARRDGKKEMKIIRRRLVDQGWVIEEGHQGYDFAIPPADFDPRPNYADTEIIPPHIKLPSSPAGDRWRGNLVAKLKKRGGYRDED